MGERMVRTVVVYVLAPKNWDHSGRTAVRGKGIHYLPVESKGSRQCAMENALLSGRDWAWQNDCESDMGIRIIVTGANMREHPCVDGTWSTKSTWWVNDAQGIPLCKVCEDCRESKLSRYRPEIITGYDQSDVDEQIDE